MQNQEIHAQWTLPLELKNPALAAVDDALYLVYRGRSRPVVWSVSSNRPKRQDLKDLNFIPSRRDGPWTVWKDGKLVSISGSQSRFSKVFSVGNSAWSIFILPFSRSRPECEDATTGALIGRVGWWDATGCEYFKVEGKTYIIISYGGRGIEPWGGLEVYSAGDLRKPMRTYEWAQKRTKGPTWAPRLCKVGEQRFVVASFCGDSHLPREIQVYEDPLSDSLNNKPIARIPLRTPTWLYACVFGCGKQLIVAACEPGQVSWYNLRTGKLLGSVPTEGRIPRQIDCFKRKGKPYLVASYDEGLFTVDFAEEGKRGRKKKARKAGEPPKRSSSGPSTSGEESSTHSSVSRKKASHRTKSSADQASHKPALAAALAISGVALLVLGRFVQKRWKIGAKVE